MRKSKVENKYNLTFGDLKKLKIGNFSNKKTFFRNDVINAWCCSENTIKTQEDSDFGCYNSYSIIIYDKPKNGSRLEVFCSAFGGMCGYNFTHFFKRDEMDCELDLEIQEKLLAKINWLIDKHILER
jgi:hypothetical protein